MTLVVLVERPNAIYMAADGYTAIDRGNGRYLTCDRYHQKLFTSEQAFVILDYKGSDNKHTIALPGTMLAGFSGNTMQCSESSGKLQAGSIKELNLQGTRILNAINVHGLLVSHAYPEIEWITMDKKCRAGAIGSGAAFANRYFIVAALTEVARKHGLEKYVTATEEIHNEYLVRDHAFSVSDYSDAVMLSLLTGNTGALSGLELSLKDHDPGNYSDAYLRLMRTFPIGKQLEDIGGATMGDFFTALYNTARQFGKLPDEIECTQFGPLFMMGVLARNYVRAWRADYTIRV